MKKNIDEVNRSFYDFKNKDDYQYKIKKGLTKDIVLEISKMKNDPEWMREIRLKGLEAYEKLELPSWGPDLSELDMDDISTYVRPKGNMSNSWEEVPEDIKDTFERLGIPESERLSLASSPSDRLAQRGRSGHRRSRAAAHPDEREPLVHVQHGRSPHVGSPGPQFPGHLSYRPQVVDAQARLGD